ncbi:MAG: hypothetical protein RLY93_13270 [Sumerlaeia bacterium]
MVVEPGPHGQKLIALCRSRNNALRVDTRAKNLELNLQEPQTRVVSRHQEALGEEMKKNEKMSGHGFGAGSEEGLGGLVKGRVEGRQGRSK